MLRPSTGARTATRASPSLSRERSASPGSWILPRASSKGARPPRASSSSSREGRGPPGWIFQRAGAEGLESRFPGRTLLSSVPEGIWGANLVRTSSGERGRERATARTSHSEANPKGRACPAERRGLGWNFPLQERGRPLLLKARSIRRIMSRWERNRRSSPLLYSRETHQDSKATQAFPGPNSLLRPPLQKTKHS